jgi:uncharacterized protein YkwD
MLRRTLIIFAITSLCGFGMACSDDDNSSDDSSERCPAGTVHDGQLDRCISEEQPDSGTDDTSPSVDSGYPDATDGGQTTPDTGTPDSGTPDSGTPDATDPPDTGGEEDTGPQCPGAEAYCDGQCVDLTSSDQHCGDCNQPCEGAQTCQSGQCQCPGDQQWCDGACVDTSSNDAHCGGCNDPCQGGYVCSEDQCHENEKIAGVIQALNTHRSTDSNCGSYGDYSAVNPVQGDAQLHQAAQRHADDMADNDFFDHTGSDGSDFSQRISESGYSGWPVGENIAAGGTDPASVVQRWMDSDGHCRNNMNGSATHVGVGFAENPSSQWGTYWVLKLAQ